MDVFADNWRKKVSPLPLLNVALGFWTGTAAAYLSAFDIAVTYLRLLALLGIVVSVVGLFLSWKSKHVLMQHAALLLVGLALGISCGMFTALSEKEKIEALSPAQWAQYRFEIVEDMRDGAFGKSCLAQTLDADGRRVQVKLTFSKDYPEVTFGDIIEASSMIRPAEKSSAQFYWQQGIVGTAKINSFEKLPRKDLFAYVTQFRKRALELMGRDAGQGKALLVAILTGERSQLDASGIYPEIRAVGLAHLVAVSGSHLVIVGAFLTSLLKAAKARRSFALVIQITFIVAYLVFTGMQISAIRAGCMSIIVLLSFFAKRRASSLNALALCIIIILSISPLTSVSVSFLLSAASTLSIIVLSPLFTEWCKAVVRALPALVRDALVLTLAANMVVMPLSAAIFSQASLVSPLANIIAVPFFAVLCTGGLLVLCLSILAPPLASFLLKPFFFISEAFCELVVLIAQIPYAAIPANLGFLPALVFSCITLAVLWYVYPRPSKVSFLRVIAASTITFCCFVFVFPLFTADEIVMIDVGQGDAFVVRSGASAVLIDTGNRDKQLLAGLSRNGVFSLDAVIITHPDDDHCASLSALRGVLPVKNVCLGKEVLECGCASCENLLLEARQLAGAESVTFLGYEDSITVGKFNLKVIFPQEVNSKCGNESSIGLLVERCAVTTWRALFTGDLEAKELNVLLEQGVVEDIDILKVGHHGSKNALDLASAAGLNPEIALISVGANNRYGHPSVDALQILEANSCEIFRSDEAGDVVCKIGDRKISVATLG